MFLFFYRNPPVVFEPFFSARRRVNTETRIGGRGTVVKAKFPIPCPKKESRAQGFEGRVKRSPENSGGSGEAVERSPARKPPIGIDYETGAR